MSVPESEVSTRRGSAADPPEADLLAANESGNLEDFDGDQDHLMDTTIPPPVFTRTEQVLVKSSIYESLDYEICENELWQKQIIEEQYSLVKQDFMRWILFIAIGIVTALVACFVDVLIEIFSDLKYAYLQKCKHARRFNCNSPESSLISPFISSHSLAIAVDQLTGDKMHVPYLSWLLLNAVPVLIGSILVTYFEVSNATDDFNKAHCHR